MKKSIFIVFASFLLTAGCNAEPRQETSNGISAVQVIKSLDKGKPVTIQGKIITDVLDFTQIKKHIIFSSSQKIAVIDVPVTFIDCIFMEKVTTNGTIEKSRINTHFGSTLTFEACDFRGEADFGNSTIAGMANFTGAIFRENAIFNNVTFQGRQVYFTACSAEKLFSMQESMTEGAIDFFKAKITGKLTFQSSVFCGLARFSDMDCSGKSDFSLTSFRSDALFTYTSFGNEFRMSDANINGKLDLISVEFQSNAWLTNSVFAGKVNLTKSEARGNFDLSGSIFTLGKPVMDNFVIYQPGQMITTGTLFANFREFNLE